MEKKKNIENFFQLCMTTLCIIFVYDSCCVLQCQTPRMNGTNCTRFVDENPVETGKNRATAVSVKETCCKVL